MYIYSFIFSLFLLMMVNACTNNSTSLPVHSTSSEKIKLSPCPPLDSAILYTDVILENYTYTGNKMIFTPQNLRLGGMTPLTTTRQTARTKKGNHLHLCIDGEQHKISNQNIFDFPLKNGKHKLVAFIARSFYESIKNPTSILAKEIAVRNGELVSSKNLPAVDIVYNAPIGLYKAEESNKILLDFVLIGTTLSEFGNTVKITLDEHTIFNVNKWQAYYLEGLSKGEHHIKLELLDPTGRQIAAPTSQSFVIKETNMNN